MQKTITTAELRQNIDAMLEDVSSQHTAYVLTSDDRPRAAVVPYDDFCRFQAFQDSELRSRWDRLLDRMAERNASFSEQEVADDVTAELRCWSNE